MGEQLKSTCPLLALRTVSMRSVHYSAVIERGEPIQSNSPISQAAAENITRVFKLFYTASGTETLVIG